MCSTLFTTILEIIIMITFASLSCLIIITLFLVLKNVVFPYIEMNTKK